MEKICLSGRLLQLIYGSSIRSQPFGFKALVICIVIIFVHPSFQHHSSGNGITASAFLLRVLTASTCPTLFLGRGLQYLLSYKFDLWKHKFIAAIVQNAVSVTDMWCSWSWNCFVVNADYNTVVVANISVISSKSFKIRSQFGDVVDILYYGHRSQHFLICLIWH